MPTQPTAEKVTAFVTRSSPSGMDLLVFEHPTAGIQLPAGTVEEGEPHAEAAAREAGEETGLADLPPGRLLEGVAETLPGDRYMMLDTARIYARPDTTSFDWASIRRGIVVRCNRPGPDFSLVTYAEHDRSVDPPELTFQITGWVATAMLTRQVMRYFYHFPYHGRTPDSWLVDIDNHRFRLFWAPLASLPAIAPSQRWWIDILERSL